VVFEVDEEVVGFVVEEDGRTGLLELERVEADVKTEKRDDIVEGRLDADVTIVAKQRYLRLFLASGSI
jgi:hypothetical protein